MTITGIPTAIATTAVPTAVPTAAVLSVVRIKKSPRTPPQTTFATHQQKYEYLRSWQYHPVAPNVNNAGAHKRKDSRTSLALGVQVAEEAEPPRDARSWCNSRCQPTLRFVSFGRS
ncbi:hypothetical protein BJ997_001117 [Cryobacterium roopkundense]|uniref:Uncharacterized protein n=1 Tax=Cryobacterium roopkundense TaxID=1001240 RepID=A0A7W9E3N4_9MICO|nr:hypothetical protein [Cryobacterium roopkundense]